MAEIRHLPTPSPSPPRGATVESTLHYENLVHRRHRFYQHLGQQAGRGQRFPIVPAQPRPEETGFAARPPPHRRHSPARPRPAPRCAICNLTPWWIGLPTRRRTSSATWPFFAAGPASSFSSVPPPCTRSLPATTYPRVNASCNPYWEYARDKIACEERLTRAWREEGFPATIVRPSLTYGDANFPVALGGWGCYTLADRMKKGQPIIVHGDGSSLWVLTHAEDFARGFCGLLGNRRPWARSSTSPPTRC